MLSEDNWIEMDWEGKIPRHIKENFTVRFKDKAERIYPFNEICDITAKQIGEKYDNLHLSFSGGADSECVANALYRNKVEFVPVIMTLGEESTSETDYAFNWCKVRNITPLHLHFDYEILKNGVYSNALKTTRARLHIGVTPTLLVNEVESRGGHLIAGMQVEYHPDEQFTGDEGIPKDYKGFLLNECDAYFEILSPNKHPWAFFYWSPEMMASVAHHWDTDLDMTRAKAKLYNTEYRPKMINKSFLGNARHMTRMRQPRSVFGTIDCALLGDKGDLLRELYD
jgi:hypothetical protein